MPKDIKLDTSFIKTVDTLKEGENTALNPSYTFSNFVVGSSNQYAYTIAKSIAENQDVIYSPVFIYGSIGLGKTHLIHAIGNEAKSKGKRVVYATIEQLMNDFTYNLCNQTMNIFRDKYRNCDVLLLDDTQFLTNKIETQEELCHMFNGLYSAGKQIVLISDKALKMMIGLDDRLKSRFGCGVIVGIDAPDLETKMSIIKKKCKLADINLSNDISSLIATNMGDDIREITSAIININAYTSLMHQEATLEIAKKILNIVQPSSEV